MKNVTKSNVLQVLTLPQASCLQFVRDYTHPRPSKTNFLGPGKTPPPSSAEALLAASANVNEVCCCCTSSGPYSFWTALDIARAGVSWPQLRL